MLIVLIDVTVIAPSKKSGVSKGALAGIIVGTFAGAVTLSAIVCLFIMRRHKRNHHAISRRRRSEYLSVIKRDAICLDNHFPRKANLKLTMIVTSVLPLWSSGWTNL